MRVIPGPKSRALCAAEREYLAPGMQRIAQLSELTLARGRGCTVVDVDGNEYLDFFAGVTVASLGHSHPGFVRALTSQIERLAVGSFTSEPRLQLMKLLAELAPGAIRRTQLYSGGAEAVEAAIRLAKAYTKKYEVVGFWGGFHGKTGGVVGLIGDEWKQKWGPLPGGTYQVPYADCYRCPFQLTYPDCGLFCLDFIRQSVKKTTAGMIAAILVEPIQGTAGNVVPPPGYLTALQAIAREHEALLIADEMLTGFGRTGLMWGSDHDRVIPDIMTVGKGIGGGFPLSGVISTEPLTRHKPWSNPSASSSSYGGNPLAAAAGLATLEIFLKEDLVRNSERVGKIMLSRLEALKEKYRCVGEVRGKGLMLGIELVRDRTTKEPLAKDITKAFYQECLRRGLLAMTYSPSIRINPPLIITEDTALAGLAILDEALGAVVRDHGLS